MKFLNILLYYILFGAVKFMVHEKGMLHKLMQSVYYQCILKLYFTHKYWFTKMYFSKEQLNLKNLIFNIVSNGTMLLQCLVIVKPFYTLIRDHHSLQYVYCIAKLHSQYQIAAKSYTIFLHRMLLRQKWTTLHKKLFIMSSNNCNLFFVIILVEKTIKTDVKNKCCQEI